MTHRDIMNELLELLRQQGVAIREDAMGAGGGGFCDLNGKKIFFHDTDSSSFDTAVKCACALKQFLPDLEMIYIKPAVREFIDKYTSAG
jgi:hypothetical protein